MTEAVLINKLDKCYEIQCNICIIETIKTYIDAI